MAREKQALKLTPVDGIERNLVPSFRLKRMRMTETLETGQPLRLEVPRASPQESKRLVLPLQEAGDFRTHQPGIDLLIGAAISNPDHFEQGWENDGSHHRHIFWGSLALAGILLTGAALWWSGQIRDPGAQADPIRMANESDVEEETRENPDGGRLAEKIESVTRKYFLASKPEALAKHIRHPERVTPLLNKYYEGRAIPVNPVLRTILLQPLTLDQRANFWMQSVELKNAETRNLIIEITGAGEPKIDWETLVCHQPMEWDTFARERPAGVSLEFRVYLEQDHFFSHEFADSSQWTCFRLTALDSEETLFGYAKTTDAVSTDLLALLDKSGEPRAPVILRVSIPHGLQSRRGLVIEKLMNPRWIYLDPPDA